MIFKNQKGMTLGEVSLALVISALLLITVISIFVPTEISSRRSLEKAHLAREVNIALRVISSDMKRTCVSRVIFYPETPPYEGMIFPLAEPSPQNIVELCEDGKVIANKTIAYHIYEKELESGGTRLDLRRSTHDDYSHVRTPYEWRQRLEQLVRTGEHPDYSTNTAFFRDFDGFDIEAIPGIFDLYSPEWESRLMHFGHVYMPIPSAIYNDDLMIRFWPEGVNPNSGGSASAPERGIDALFIGPSNHAREFEYYHEGIGQRINKQTGGVVAAQRRMDGDASWSNDNWISYASNGYMEITDSWDLIRESSFTAGGYTRKGWLRNMTVEGEMNHLQVHLPNFAYSVPGESINFGSTVWHALDQSSEAQPELREIPTALNHGNSDTYVVRNQIQGDFINITDREADQNRPNFIRVSFLAGDSDLDIKAAYITRKRWNITTNKAARATGMRNEDPLVLPLNTDPVHYHHHQQLFFKDGPDVSASTTIPARQAAFSEWTAFPFCEDHPTKNNNDYFVTLVIEGDHNRDGVFFPSDDSLLNPARSWFVFHTTRDSYLEAGGDPTWVNDLQINNVTLPGAIRQMAGTWFVLGIDFASSSGEYESGIYDTRHNAGDPSAISWDERINRSVGTESNNHRPLKFLETGVRFRFNDDDDISEFNEWDTYHLNEQSPGEIGQYMSRFYQFKVEASASPYFKTPSQDTCYDRYVRDNSGLDPHLFQRDAQNRPYMADAYYHEIDHVTLNWRRGTGAYVNISGIVAMHPDAGRMSVSIVDSETGRNSKGHVLKRDLSFRIRKSVDIGGKLVEEDRSLIVTPMNNNRFTRRLFP